MREQLKNGPQPLDARTDKELSWKSVVVGDFGDGTGPEPGLCQHLEPQSAWKQAQFVPIVHDRD